MPQHQAFTGLRGDIEVEQASRWAGMLVKAAFAVLAIGLIVTLFLWPLVSADAGALTLAIAFAGGTGLMVLRQALLAERR